MKAPANTTEKAIDLAKRRMLDAKRKGNQAKADNENATIRRLRAEAMKEE